MKAEGMKYLKMAHEMNKHVYFLTGEPEWALDENAKEIKKLIRQIETYGEQPSLQGVVIDIEPYLLEEFKYQPEEVMENYTKGLIEAYRFAKLYRLKVIVCIPYYLDTLGFTQQLESIIKFGSDAVAVMNYYRGKENEHIETELKLSQLYNKPIISIYELQKPCTQGLIDMNTYHQLGLQAV